MYDIWKKIASFVEFGHASCLYFDKLVNAETWTTHTDLSDDTTRGVEKYHFWD